MILGAVLFDIGSTLVQGPELSPAGVICRLLGLADSEKGRVADIIMCSPFRDRRQMCRRLRDAFPSAGFPEELIEKVWTDQETAPQEIPGATEAVRHVRRAGFMVGLVSDIWEPYYKGFLAACPELCSMVDYTGLSFREGVRKPSALLLEKAIQSLGMPAEHAWMVGDTYRNDLLPAAKLGMRTIWVLNRPEKEYPAMEEVLKGRLPRPDIIVDTVGDICKIDLREWYTVRIRNSEFIMGKLHSRKW